MRTTKQPHSLAGDRSGPIKLDAPPPRSVTHRNRGSVATTPADPPGLRGDSAVFLNLLLYRKVVRLWWTYDDPGLLRMIVPSGFAEPFLGFDDTASANESRPARIGMTPSPIGTTPPASVLKPSGKGMTHEWPWIDAERQTNDARCQRSDAEVSTE
jgi:hypothetical protein